MRHRVLHKSFGRSSKKRASLMKSLVLSLVKYERIRTTLPKAKELKRHAEKAVSLAKKQNLNSLRLLQSRYPDKQMSGKLYKDLAPRFKDRKGGYTRVIKLGTRPGDKAEMAFIEFVDYVPKEKEKVKDKKTLLKEKKDKSRKVSRFKKKKRSIQKLSRRKNRN